MNENLRKFYNNIKPIKKYRKFDESILKTVDLYDI